MNRMNSMMCRTLSALSVLAMPGVLLAQVGGAAAEHEAHASNGPIPSVQQGLATGITALVVFAIVAAILGGKVWPVIGKALDERSAKIRDEIAAAELARKQAKDALAQYEKNLADARAEAQAMLEQAKSQQQALALELKAKAEVELNQMRERAKRDIDAAKRAAVNEIYSQAVTLATTAAGKILQREVGTDDQARLLEESLNEMGAGGAVNGTVGHAAVGANN